MITLWNRIRSWFRKRKRVLSPWKHFLQFLAILIITYTIKYAISLKGWIMPPLAAWEFAALSHVYLVALRMMRFRGFEFATKGFNNRVRSTVLTVIGFLIGWKFLSIVLETTLSHSGVPVVAATTASALEMALRDATHAMSAYIIPAPLFFFLIVNLVARWHVRRHARALGFEQTDQERYLVGLTRFVDAPVVFPFVVLFVYLRIDPVIEVSSESTVFEVIGCCLLIVSNILAGVFDDHWAEVIKIRRKYSSEFA
jgi:hypothetical protein